MNVRGGPISVVEACYDLAASEEAWLQKIADTMHRLIGAPKPGLIGYQVSFNEDRSIRITNPVHAQGRKDVLARIQSMADLLERRRTGRASLLECVQAKVHEAVIRGGLRTPADQMLMSEIDKIGPDWMYTLGVPDVRDHFFLISHHIDGHGATLLVGGLTQRASLAPAERRMHQMLSAHIKAGLRLRLRLRLGVRALGADRPLPDRRRQRCARGVAGARVRPLVAGRAARRRWPAVHARAQEPGGRAHPRGFTNMESGVIGLAVRGYSNKVIAYHLGISEGTAAAHLHAAMGKLKIESRVELVRLLGSHYPQRTDPRFLD